MGAPEKDDWLPWTTCFTPSKSKKWPKADSEVQNEGDQIFNNQSQLGPIVVLTGTLARENSSINGEYTI